MVHDTQHYWRQTRRGERDGERYQSFVVLKCEVSEGKINLVMLTMTIILVSIFSSFWGFKAKKGWNYLMKFLHQVLMQYVYEKYTEGRGKFIVEFKSFPWEAFFTWCKDSSHMCHHLPGKKRQPNTQNTQNRMKSPPRAITDTNDIKNWIYNPYKY